MKLLFDQNLSYKLCGLLGDQFPGSAQVRLLGLDRASDDEIWRYAGDNGFTLVTMDTDFLDFATLHGAPPRVILLRCGNQPTSVIADLLLEHALRIAVLDHQDEVSCLEIP